jgi:hypothetical protein
MTGKNTDYRIPKHPELPTPISDIGLEPKSRSKPTASLEAISNFAEIAKDLPKHEKASLLGKAIREQDTESVRILAANGADLNPESYGYPTNLLCDCCFQGHIDMARTLLACGADPNRFGMEGGFPLLASVSNGTLSTQVRAECATLLLDFGADIDGMGDRRAPTALQYVCHNDPDNIELVVFLLLRGANTLVEHFRGTRPALQPSHIRGLTKPFKEALDADNKSEIDNCITVLGKLLPDDTAASLLAQWAGLAIHDTMAFRRIHGLIESYLENLDADLPVMATRYLPDLTKSFTAALAAGNSVEIEHCLTILESFLPRSTAASLLVRWAELSIHHETASRAIHSIIENYLKMLDGDPPVNIARYIACYNARCEREGLAEDFKTAKIEPVGVRDIKVLGDYSVQDHGLLMIRLAAAHALDPDADPDMVHVMALLKFVAATAAGAPRPVRVALHNEAVKLQSELFNNAVPELVERASSVRDFLKQGPFALDKLE